MSQEIKYQAPQHFTYENGFAQALPDHRPNGLVNGHSKHSQDNASYKDPVAVPVPTSAKGIEYGVFHEHTFPSVMNGTNCPQGPPKWFKKEKEVDVLICGAGPTGLQVAISMLRQGCSFRIIDRSEGPLVIGRADSVHPRYLETLEHWGLATDVAVRGIVITRTAAWKDGRNLVFRDSHMSDSRYRGLDGTTQHCIEQVYLRDLLRHRKIVERLTSVKEFTVDDEDSESEYKVKATLVNLKTGEEEVVRCKHLVGADGASSTIRKQLNIDFQGVSTGIYWGIIDAVFESTYPHFGIFGPVVSSKHGGCVWIPREDGMMRLYVQIDPNGVVGKERLAEGGQMDMGDLTPEEVLAQANRIFAPYTIRIASPISWFAIWKISERVAENYTYKNRVHLAGDACHVHSVMGAFGLNASILDAANLGWKLGLACLGRANLAKLMPTYTQERRRHAERIIHLTGTYLRFANTSQVPAIRLRGIGTEDREDGPRPVVPENPDIEDPDKRFLAAFYANNGGFLLGVDCEYGNTILTPTKNPSNPLSLASAGQEKATVVKWGVRAPNPRVTFGFDSVGYLYDLFGRGSKFSVLVFASDMRGPILPALVTFARHLEEPTSFASRWKDLFEFVFITKLLPLDLEEYFAEDTEETKVLKGLYERSRLAIDDELPEKDAHNIYGVSHARGALVVVRPDLWTGVSVFPEEGRVLDEYFGRFLI